jgi:large subunit ribosomal protein L32
VPGPFLFLGLFIAFFNYFSILPFMVVRMRHTRSHTKNRRSHHALEAAALSKCPKCAAPQLRHTVCANCGTYKGVEYVDVLAKLSKNDKKAKQAALAEGEKSLDAEKLSNK